jgi:hypothetical protein
MWNGEKNKGYFDVETREEPRTLRYENARRTKDTSMWKREKNK